MLSLQQVVKDLHLLLQTTIELQAAMCSALTLCELMDIEQGDHATVPQFLWHNAGVQCFMKLFDFPEPAAHKVRAVFRGYPSVNSAAPRQNSNDCDAVHQSGLASRISWLSGDHQMCWGWHPCSPQEKQANFSTNCIATYTEYCVKNPHNALRNGTTILSLNGTRALTVCTDQHRQAPVTPALHACNVMLCARPGA